MASFKQLAVLSIHARDECWMPALSKDKLPAICVKTCNFTPLSTYFLRLHPKFQNGEKNSVSFDSYIIFFFYRTLSRTHRINRGSESTREEFQRVFIFDLLHVAMAVWISLKEWGSASCVNKLNAKAFYTSEIRPRRRWIIATSACLVALPLNYEISRPSNDGSIKFIMYVKSSSRTSSQEHIGAVGNF